MCMNMYSAKVGHYRITKLFHEIKRVVVQTQFQTSNITVFCERKTITQKQSFLIPVVYHISTQTSGASNSVTKLV